MNRTAFYYDTRRNLTCVLDPDNGLTYYTHDASNRMTSVKNPWGEVTQYEYSPGGRLLKRLLGNGTVAYYSHDAVGQVRKVENVKSDLSVISSFEYERNALGSPLSILREDGSVIYYEYDAKQQLTKETHVDPLSQQVYGWTWDYDPAGNRTRQEFNGVETTYSYNAANELTEETTDGDTTYYEYDHNGNTTAKVAPGGTTLYHWDRENLMTQVDLPDGGHNYFAYDADGKRVEKRDGDGYTRFIYQGPDMLKLLQERDESDALRAQYTMGNGLEAMRRDDASSFYHFDWLGSTFELTDETEAVTDAYSYNAWGEVLGRTGTTDNPHVYGGRLRYWSDHGLDLHTLGVRRYRPNIGRFLSVDPVGPDDRGYLYTGNVPVTRVDPSGRFYLGVATIPCECFKAKSEDLPGGGVNGYYVGMATTFGRHEDPPSLCGGPGQRDGQIGGVCMDDYYMEGAAWLRHSSPSAWRDMANSRARYGKSGVTLTCYNMHPIKGYPGTRGHKFATILVDTGSGGGGHRLIDLLPLSLNEAWGKETVAPPASQYMGHTIAKVCCKADGVDLYDHWRPDWHLEPAKYARVMRPCTSDADCCRKGDNWEPMG
jgi:RHS repeat-associated protein